MHDGMPYGRNQGQGQGHSREVDRQSPMGLILLHSFTGKGSCRLLAEIWDLPLSILTAIFQVNLG